MISAKVNSEINFPFKVRSGTGSFDLLIKYLIFTLKEFRHVIFRDNSQDESVDEFCFGNPILATRYWLMLMLL